MLPMKYRRGISMLLLLCMLLSLVQLPQGLVLQTYAAVRLADEDEPPKRQNPVAAEVPAELDLPTEAEPVPAERMPSMEEESVPAEPMLCMEEEDAPAEPMLCMEEADAPAEPVPSMEEADAPAEPDPPAEPEPQPEEEDENILFRADLPTYYQNDYAYVRFGSGTVANNGCSVTALAMVASYMTGHPYTPDALADYFGGRAENNIARLEIASRTLQLAYRKARDWNQVYDALQKGKVAIVLVAAPSAFTNSQHFIVLHGITKDGKVLVTDPNNQNHLKWDLQQGFENGFDSYEIWSGWEGGWIYDKAAMPKNPIFYEEPRIDHSNPRFPEVEARLTPDDIDLMAKVVWAEARGESLEGQRAVAEVILNRLHSPNFPDSLYDVIYGEGQFRTAWLLDEATPYQTQYEAIEMALYGPDYVLPETVVYFGWEKVNTNVWGWIGKHVFCHEFNMPVDKNEDPEELPEVPVPEVPVTEESGMEDSVPEETAPVKPASEEPVSAEPVSAEPVSGESGSEPEAVFQDVDG